MDITGNIKGFLENVTHTIPAERLEIGEAAALWYAARTKLIGLSVLEIFLSQAQDLQLKALIQYGMEEVAIPHIEKIQNLLHKEGVEVPSVHQRTNLNLLGKDTGSHVFIKDDEIAISVREILRLALMNEYKGMVDATRDDIMDLFLEMYLNDYKSYREIVKLSKEKHWLIQSPALH